MFERNFLNQKPDLEKMFDAHSISKTEKLFLDKLEKKLCEKIIRQVRFGRWVVDGLTENSGIVIEYDGKQNHESKEKKQKDEMRDQELVLTYQVKAIYRLLWFDFINDYEEYLQALDKAVDLATDDIKILRKLWIN